MENPCEKCDECGPNPGGVLERYKEDCPDFQKYRGYLEGLAERAELLDALKLAATTLRCVGVDENNDCCGVTYTCPNCRAGKVIDAAIAKAEGR
jgi:hypothetical protein